MLPYNFSQGFLKNSYHRFWKIVGALAFKCLTKAWVQLGPNDFWRSSFCKTVQIQIMRMVAIGSSWLIFPWRCLQSMRLSLKSLTALTGVKLTGNCAQREREDSWWLKEKAVLWCVTCNVSGGNVLLVYYRNEPGWQVPLVVTTCAQLSSNIIPATRPCFLAQTTKPSCRNSEEEERVPGFEYVGSGRQPIPKCPDSRMTSRQSRKCWWRWCGWETASFRSQKGQAPDGTWGGKCQTKWWVYVDLVLTSPNPHSWNLEKGMPPLFDPQYVVPSCSLLGSKPIQEFRNGRGKPSWRVYHSHHRPGPRRQRVCRTAWRRKRRQPRQG